METGCFILMLFTGCHLGLMHMIIPTMRDGLLSIMLRCCTCQTESLTEVYEEFKAGNFVIKKSNGRFNQAPIAQGTGWVNKMCKVSSGITGITRNGTARDKFCITWAQRFVISDATRDLLGLVDDGDSLTT